MNVSIISVFPELYTSFLNTSLVARAQQKGLVNCEVDSFFSFVQPKERIDAPTYGHGAGMLIKPEVVQKAVETYERKHGPAYKIFFSPQGKKLNQRVLEQVTHEMRQKGHCILLPARYEGMDARVEEEYADVVLSIGDFVVMGGDLPAMMFLEASLRLIPGVIGKQESVEKESFSGPFFDFPTYTEPVEWKGRRVPDIVRSGHHGALDEWRMQEAAKKTVYTHFEWLRSQPLTDEQKNRVRAIMPRHYAALMHTNVLVSAERKPGTTSVTSLDLHDIARSARTYNLEHYFIVTPLTDQQKVVQRLLNFWHTGPGKPYNPNRFEAVKHVSLQSSLADVKATIKAQEGIEPLVIATSAYKTVHPRRITFHDQAEVWRHKRPVLFIFGTGRGLSEECVAQADYLLIQVEGIADFNHLSVRSAAAIIFDRWLGLNSKTP